MEHRSPYALRHTFATFAIAAGVPLFELSRFMGTSVEQIGRTYGHLLPDSLDRARTALDTYLVEPAERKAEEKLAAFVPGVCPWKPHLSRYRYGGKPLPIRPVL